MSSPPCTFKAQGGTSRLVSKRVQESHELGCAPLCLLWITRGAVGPSSTEACRWALPLPLGQGRTSRHWLLPTATESGDLTAKSAACVSLADVSATPVLGNWSKRSIINPLHLCWRFFRGGHGNSSRPGVEKLWPLSQERFLHF